MIADMFTNKNLNPIVTELFIRRRKQIFFSSLSHKLIWGHPHSTYTRKSPKLDPPLPLYAIVRIWLDPPLCVRTFYIFNPPLHT